MSTKYKYGHASHFISAMERINNSDIEDVVVKIEKKMEDCGLTKNTLTKRHIRMFLLDGEQSNFHSFEWK